MPGGQARYLIILGYGGEEFGLAFYPTLRDLRIQLMDVDPERPFEHVTAASLTFSEAQALTFDDLDAIENIASPSTSWGRIINQRVFFSAPDSSIGAAVNLLPRTRAFRLADLLSRTPF